MLKLQCQLMSHLKKIDFGSMGSMGDVFVGVGVSVVGFGVNVVVVGIAVVGIAVVGVVGVNV